MSNRRHSEFKKGFEADGPRPRPGTSGGGSLSESSPSKTVGYPSHGAGSVGYPSHGRKVKSHPEGSI